VKQKNQSRLALLASIILIIFFLSQCDWTPVTDVKGPKAILLTVDDSK